MAAARALLILLLCSGANGACEYTRTLIVSTPNLEALSGSCLRIPCTFTIDPKFHHQFDPTKPVKAIWSRTHPFLNRPGEDKYVVYNSDRPSNSPMTMIGDLRRKNCTTLFSNINSVHSDEYYLRIENDQFKATAVCDAPRINVQDSPWSPSVQVSGQQKEKESVTITCSAPTPCPDSPPKLSWSLQQDPPNTMVTNTDRTFTTSIREEMTLSDRHDGLQVTCSAVYPVSGGEKRANGSFSLRVEYSPKDTSVQRSGNTSLSVGEPVNLSCSSRANPPVQNISWFRVTSEGPQRVHHGQVYSFTFSRSTQGQYFCQAKNQVGEQNSPVITLGHEDAPWKLILGGVGVGLLILIGSAIFIWRLLSKRQPPEEPQSETYAEVNREEDTVHYGEIAFAKPRPNRSAAVVRQAEDPEETMYSQVRVPKARGEDVYATVKRS